MPKKTHAAPRKQKKGMPVATGAQRFARWLHSPEKAVTERKIAQEPHNFTDNPNWRIFRIMAEFIEGYEFLSKFHAEVTIFGSTRALPNSPYYKIAKELGLLLGRAGYTVITGGGPGIMEAANWGAYDAGGVSVGLDIDLPTEQRRNQFATKAMGFHYFFTRKVMLSASAQAYVFFPGGFGTLDEMTEMVTLIQTGKIPRDVPAILVGKKFWTPFLSWLDTEVREENRFLERDEIKILQLVDTAEEAFKIIQKTYERGLE